jgi:Winged helix-turn-helix DNA-binding
MIPPVEDVRELLRIVADGTCGNHLPRDILLALQWAETNGLIEKVSCRMTKKGERYRRVIDKTVPASYADLRPFESAEEWIEWLRSLDPITAIRIGSMLVDGKTVSRLAATIDEITYVQTIAGGGEMTQSELAETVGVSVATIARRTRRRLAAQREVVDVR